MDNGRHNPEKSTSNTKNTPEKKPRETVGTIVSDILASETGNEKVSPVELEQEAHKDYEKQLFAAVEDGKKVFPGDFFLEVITINYKVLARTISNKIVIRKTAPTPTYDSTAYHYHRLSDHLEFLWVVPSKEACLFFKRYALQVAPEERALRDFVLEFYDGTLLKRCKKLNNEKEDSNIIDMR
jgi:hypothetical protein